jgi:hypothetical protein
MSSRGIRLAISALPARVLAVPDKEHLFLRVEVCPFYSADFVLTHRGRDSGADDPPDRNLLILESSDQTVQFILRWSPVALIPLPNETKPCERNARQNDGLDREYNAVNRRRVRQNGLDISQIDSDRDGTCAFARRFLSKLDEPPAIKFRDP